MAKIVVYTLKDGTKRVRRSYAVTAGKIKPGAKPTGRTRHGRKRKTNAVYA